MSSLLRLALSLLLTLTACGDSNDDGDAVGEPPEDPITGTVSPSNGTYLFGGTFCAINGETTNGIMGIDPGDRDDTVDDSMGPGRPAANDVATCQVLPTDLASTGLLPTGSGFLMFDGKEYTLDSAIRVVPLGRGASNELLLHDGETRVRQRTERSYSSDASSVAYGVYDGTVSLSFALVPGDASGNLAGRVYQSLGDTTVGVDGQMPTGEGIALGSDLIADIDGDGTISENEFLLIDSGRIVWSGTEDMPSLSFNLVLQDGRPVEGAYEGGYERVE